MKQVQHNAGPGLLVGLPTLGRPVPLEWAFAFKAMAPPLNYNINFQIIRGQPIDVARNEMAKHAISIGAKYLFFLGDDVVCPPHTLRQLIFRLENNPNIAVTGGVYCCKSDPANPLVFRGNGKGCYWDWKIGEFFSVSGLGMDCTLIRVSVLEKMEQGTWFKTVDEDKYLDGINNAEAWTEDLYFFDQLHKQLPDEMVFCDASVICEHWDVYAGKAYKIPVDSLPMRRKVVVAGQKKCLFLGPRPAPSELRSEIDYTFFSSEEIADYRGEYSSLPFAPEEFDEVIAHPSINQTDLMRAEVLRVLKTPVGV